MSFYLGSESLVQYLFINLHKSYRIYEKMPDELQRIIQATYVAEPLKTTISFSLDLSDILIKCHNKRADFVPVIFLSFTWPLIKTARPQSWTKVELLKFNRFCLSPLEEINFVSKLAHMDCGVPPRLLLLFGLVFDDTWLLGDTIIFLKATIVELFVVKPCNRSHVLEILKYSFRISDTVITCLIFNSAKSYLPLMAGYHKQVWNRMISSLLCTTQILLSKLVKINAEQSTLELQ